MTSMKQGFRFIRTQGAMETLFIIAFCMTALAIPMITFLPVFAKNVFQKDEITYTRSFWLRFGARFDHRRAQRCGTR